MSARQQVLSCAYPHPAKGGSPCCQYTDRGPGHAGPAQRVHARRGRGRGAHAPAAAGAAHIPGRRGARRREGHTGAGAAWGPIPWTCRLPRPPQRPARPCWPRSPPAGTGAAWARGRRRRRPGRCTRQRRASPSPPASTTKVATAIAALACSARRAVHHARRQEAGDSGAGRRRGSDTRSLPGIPPPTTRSPATLRARGADRHGRSRPGGPLPVRLGYDASLYSGPGMAPGWTEAYVTSGNVTPITALEVDQGRLTPGGAPEDSDDPVNFRPRSEDPAAADRHGVRGVSATDGITVTGTPPSRGARGRPGRSARQLAAAVGHGRADDAGKQQRDRGEPGPARRDRHGPARLVRRRATAETAVLRRLGSPAPM